MDASKRRNDQKKWRLPAEARFTYVSEAWVRHWVEKGQPLWLCGGAKVYKTFLPLCDEVYATIVLDEYEGDIYMPHFEDQFPYSEILQETKNYWMVRYWKNKELERF